MIRLSVVMGIILLAAVVPGSACAQDNAQTRQTLAGIDKLSVIVERLPESAEKISLSSDAIQTDVELKFVVAGLHVVPVDEHYNLPGKPYLYINVNLTPDAKVASVDVELRQNVRLERKSDLASVVTTWSLGTLMENPSEQTVRARVKEHVDAFLKAWTAANPKN
jgi:hypothetical protein